MANGGQGQVEALQHRSLVGHTQHGGVTVPGALIGHNLDLVGVLRRLLDEVVQADVAIDAAQKELLLVGTKSERADLGAHRYRGNGGALHLSGGQLVRADLRTDVPLAGNLLLQRDDLAFAAPQKINAQRIVFRPAISDGFQLQAKEKGLIWILKGITLTPYLPLDLEDMYVGSILIPNRWPPGIDLVLRRLCPHHKEIEAAVDGQVAGKLALRGARYDHVEDARIHIGDLLRPLRPCIRSLQMHHRQLVGIVGQDDVGTGEKS